jgi:hypothetical protein
MVNDYSGTYVAINYRNKKKSPKKKASSTSWDFFSLTTLMWKTLGAMLLITVVIGITSTIWYGWQVQLALNQIGGNKITNTELASENRLLIAQRDLMLTQEYMKKTAGRIGLYSPTKSQLRYP